MDADAPIIDDRFWEHLRYRGVRLKTQVLRDSPSPLPWYRELYWQSFKRVCASDGNRFPLLIYYAYPQTTPEGLFRRHGSRKPRQSDPFGELPMAEYLEAERIFNRLCERWAGNMPSWRRAILNGVSKRLALHPPDSAWGKRMRRIKGGVHCQRKYLEEGGHPLPTVRQAMTKRQRGQLTSEDRS
jgi:hypothetical protein